MDLTRKIYFNFLDKSTVSSNKQINTQNGRDCEFFHILWNRTGNTCQLGQSVCYRLPKDHENIGWDWDNVL